VRSDVWMSAVRGLEAAGGRGCIDRSDGFRSHGLFGLMVGDELQTGGLPSERKGASVARERPIASNVVPLIRAAPEHSEPDAWGLLTRAELRALRRSTPLTPEQFKARGASRSDG
jgi:hypothetical protein